MTAVSYLQTAQVLGALSTLALAACGGGDTATGGGGPAPAPPVALIQNAQPYAPEAGSDALIGVQANAAGGLSTAQLLTVTGLNNPTTGQLKLTDGSTFFTDPDGPDAQDVARDGRSLRIAYNDLTGTYQFARLYTGVDISADGTSSGVFIGVVGQEAASGQITSSGSATYSGEAIADLRTNPTDTQASQTFNYDNGSATAVVNFGAQSANVTMSGFQLPAGAPFDRIAITGMTLNGNRLSGGTVSTTLNGQGVNPVGANRKTVAAGVLLGNVTGGIPDEIGGIAYARGDGGALFGAFVGD